MEDMTCFAFAFTLGAAGYPCVLFAGAGCAILIGVSGVLVRCVAWFMVCGCLSFRTNCCPVLGTNQSNSQA